MCNLRQKESPSLTLSKWRLPVCSMLALNPQTGESSDASLGVPFKALLHRPNAGSTHRYPRYCTATWKCTDNLRASGILRYRRLFVCVAMRHRLPTLHFLPALICPSQKRQNEETTASREVYRTPYWGKEKKSFGCYKDIVS